ncbi:MAG: OmpA family protein [Candidatus Kapaibacterium sp.]|nr:OmpA family protein [Bacteroidota bacterium]
MSKYVLVVMLLAVVCSAQEKPHEPYSYGGYGLFGSNKHTANFQKLPNYPNCCPHFENGLGYGINIGGHLQYNMSNWLWVAGRAGYSSLGGTLTALEQSSLTTVTTSTGVEQARINHTITAHIGSLTAEPMVGVEPISNIHFYVSAPIYIGIQRTFDQVEKLDDNQEGIFTNGLRTRNEFTNQPLPQANSLLLSAAVGVRFEVPLTKHNTILLSPEAKYVYVFGNISSAVEWKVSSVQAGLSFRYSPLIPPVMKYDTIIYRDTILDKSYDITAIQYDIVRDSTNVIEEEVGYNTVLRTTERWFTTKKTLPEKRPHYLQPSITVKGLEADGFEKNVATVNIEEVVGYSIQPLLPYIFFAENSDTVPTRYVQLLPEQCQKFEVNNLRRSEALDIYHHVLNIIGRRMLENPTAVLTLTGCNQNTGTEMGSTDLSKRRAEAVRDYFVKNWNLDSKRIKIKSQNLPAVPSNKTSPDGMEENRRVEITCTHPDVMRNVILLDTILRTESISSLRFYPKVKTSSGIKDWSIHSVMSDSITKVLQGNGTPSEQMDWNINNELKHAPHDMKEIAVRLTMRDKLDSSAQVQVALPVQMITKQDREKVNNKYVDKYSLILYEFGQYVHTPAHLAMIKYIREHSKPTSTFYITGHTDRSGSAEYNMQLSTKRAEYTAKALELPVTVSKGYGKEQELYDNNLPEGRMYNRTVNIVVETPVE